MTRPAFTIVAIAVGSLYAILTVSAQNAPFPRYPYNGPTLRSCPPPAPQPAPVARTVNVRVPLPCPPGPRTNCSRGARYGAPPPGHCGPPTCVPPPKPRPVQVEVRVRPDLPCESQRVPLAWRDPGPLKAIISSGFALLQATISAPFKAAEMVVPCPWKRKYRPPVQPNSQCAHQRPSYPTSMIGCPPPIACTPCPPPMTGAPVGPSVAPLPQAARPPQCGPYMPPRMVRNARFPMFEPGSLVGGIVNLPFRFVGRGRLIGNLRQPYCAPR
jgi:hypothetical protein